MKTNRRDFMQLMGLGVAGLGLSTVSCVPTRQNSQSDDQILFINDDVAIVDTQYGKVQGFKLNDVFQFRGIPYGQDTSGENRFMPPKPPEKWDGVYPAVWWGNSAPQYMNNRYANSVNAFQDNWNYDDVSEDCLKLNVWTSNINDNQNRPVLVWLHGGGFRNGNGIEQDGYKGENLSKESNVVFVSINHRLGPIGFSDLSSFGDKYKYSGNVGALDMLAALEWVRDNIRNFGGDPNNVTIMGQSGGGAKVCTVMAMERAKGLFHKAVSLSGSTLNGLNKQVSAGVGELILAEAGLSRNEVDKLQSIPWNEYLVIADRAARKYTEINGSAGMRGAFGPVADGDVLPEESYFSNPNGLSSDVPLLICSTFHEWNVSRDNAEMENWSFEKVIEELKTNQRLSGGLESKSESVVNAYRESFPDASPIDIMSMIVSNRRGVVSTATAKSKQSAPVYVAWFGWVPPMFGGRMRAFHCLDICFWFKNTDLMITHTGGGSRPRELSNKMSNALVEFMKTGNPNNSQLPSWSQFTVENGETMILNDECQLVNDPDKKGRELL